MKKFKIEVTTNRANSKKVGMFRTYEVQADNLPAAVEKAKNEFRDEYGHSEPVYYHHHKIL